MCYHADDAYDAVGYVESVVVYRCSMMVEKRVFPVQMTPVKRYGSVSVVLYKEPLLQ